MASDQLLAGLYRRSLRRGDRDRTYLLHVPARFDGQQPLPLMFAFHGSGSDSEGMRQFCGMDEKADEAGFFVVYPDGSGRADRAYTWNAGNCCGHAHRQRVDDLGFLRALLDELLTILPVDQSRVYATGMSNGAMVCYMLAAEMSERFAAIAPVGGPMGTETCHPRYPVPIIHFHGTHDLFAPLAGGKGPRSLSQVQFLSVEHTIRQWVAANGCRQEPEVEQVLAPAEGLSATRTRYLPDKTPAEVVLYTIEGGGHTWPGREPHWDFLGRSLLALPANDLIWEFFQRYSRQT